MNRGKKALEAYIYNGTFVIAGIGGTLLGTQPSQWIQASQLQRIFGGL